MRGYRFVRFCSSLLTSCDLGSYKLDQFDYRTVYKHKRLDFYKTGSKWIDKVSIFMFSGYKDRRFLFQSNVQSELLGEHVNEKARLFSIESFEPYESAANTRMDRLI